MLNPTVLGHEKHWHKSDRQRKVKKPRSEVAEAFVKRRKLAAAHNRGVEQAVEGREVVIECLLEHIRNTPITLRNILKEYCDISKIPAGLLERSCQLPKHLQRLIELQAPGVRTTSDSDDNQALPTTISDEAVAVTLDSHGSRGGKEPVYKMTAATIASTSGTVENTSNAPEFSPSVQSFPDQPTDNSSTIDGLMSSTQQSSFNLDDLLNVHALDPFDMQHITFDEPNLFGTNWDPIVQNSMATSAGVFTQFLPEMHSSQGGHSVSSRRLHAILNVLT